MDHESRTFEQRKRDHIRIALDPKAQAVGKTGLTEIELIHEALPDLDFDEVSIDCDSLGQSFQSPIFISSMTAGHRGSLDINSRLAQASARKGWLMGVGSQRKELFDDSAKAEWSGIRKHCPGVRLAGNIGLSQVITTEVSAIQELVHSLEAVALFVHTNPLQECIQPEGTPQFKGGLLALENLCRNLEVPVILKEVGCGFSKATLQRLVGTGLTAVDVSGLGGTHWGRIEGYRREEGDLYYNAAQTFASWGIATVDSLQALESGERDYDLWASGGVRSGLDVAKLIALGAEMVGVAQPMLEAALVGEAELEKRMELLDFELRVALFVTGCKNLSELRERKLWRRIRT